MRDTCTAIWSRNGKPREDVAAYADALLAGWVATGASSRIETGGDPTLSARRRWWCDVPGGPAVIPCGGTHVPDLGRLGRVRVAYEPTEDGFEVVTTVGEDASLRPGRTP